MPEKEISYENTAYIYFFTLPDKINLCYKMSSWTKVFIIITLYLTNAISNGIIINPLTNNNVPINF